MRANGFEAQPQDLVMTFLGAYVVPHDRLVWSGGLVTLLGDFGFSTGASRVASGAHGPPRRPRAIAQRPPRLLPPDAAHRRSAGGGRPADLLLGPRAAPRGALDRAVARDPGGAPARARSSGAAPALPRLRLGAGRDVDLAPRPRGGGGGADRVARRRRVRGRVGRPSRRRARLRRARLARVGPRRARLPLPRVHRRVLDRPPPPPTSTRRSGCARGWCTCSAASRRSTPSSRTS